MKTWRQKQEKTVWKQNAGEIHKPWKIQYL